MIRLVRSRDNPPVAEALLNCGGTPTIIRRGPNMDPISKVARGLRDMSRDDIPNLTTGSMDETILTQMARTKGATQTIDLSSLFSRETPKTDAFDVKKVKLASFGQLLQAISVPTLLIARSHSVRFANAAFQKLSKEDFSLKGITFSSFFPTPKEARKAQLLLEEVFAERKPRIRETRLQIHKTRIWGRLHLCNMRLGQQQMVLVQIENLTAQKELLTIQKYKKLVKIFPIGIVEFWLRKPLPRTLPRDKLLDGILRARVVDGNNEFARMYKLSSIERLMGAALGKLFPAKGKGIIVYEEWIDKGFPISSFNTKESGDSDGLQYYENTLIGNVSKDSLLGFWWLKRDISDKKRMEEELLKGQKLEALGILAGGIAHDFNNLLTGILGNISLAQMCVKPSHRAFRRMEAAGKAAVRARDLTRQLLPFSRGGAPIKKTASVAEIIKDCATFVLRGSKVRCEFGLPHDLWPVQIDEGQISQVINNLIINAVQAMPEGGTITVRAVNVRITGKTALPLEKGKYVRISVSDTGVGIPQDHLNKIFDPYFTTKPKGTGLGLATSYSIVKKHGGLMTVDSDEGIGTTFYFFLPSSGGEASPVEGPERPLVRGKGRILVMDDEALIRDLAGEFLTLMGYSVGFARNGTEAIRAYKEAMDEGEPFDAVIMDLTIPGGMGGKEAIQRLRRIDPHIKAVVSSGYSNDPIMSAHEKYGFKGVLPKPYDGNQLSEVLDNVIKNT